MKITKDSTIGEIIENIPQAGPIIQKYFHGGCFECPGVKMETLEMGAMLHGHDVETIIAELKMLSSDK
ncbi:MAG: DUF1858 domain-containing protein [candidate division Zixibacteria bacterium]|nr:DUF1858 domain-containing protein [candidate division Zixibacteria bacterium]